MILTDNHIHSSCSGDGHNSMTEMMLASYERGVRSLCFTDHVDLDHFRTGVPDLQCYDIREDMIKMFELAKVACPRDMDLFLGIELGEGNHDLARMEAIASSPELDFVLGSLHNLRNTVDFHDMNYPDMEFCRKKAEIYVEELIELAGLPYFDVMAHIGYITRYIRRSGFTDFSMNMNTHGEGLDALLKKLIANGRGIEINCSGLRNPRLRETMPSFDVLARYKELGGEIITVGSDAHTTADAASGIREGFDILRQLGYNYVTVFKRRKPDFIKI